MKKWQLTVWEHGPCPVVPRRGHTGFKQASGETGPGCHPEVSGILSDIAVGLEFGGRTPELVAVPPSEEARALLAAVMSGADPDDDEPEEPTPLDSPPPVESDDHPDSAPVGVVIDVAAWESRRWMPREE